MASKTDFEIRALRPDEIECRVQQATAKGVMLLLYKDARCDMAVLDETFTPFGWQRRHSVINNKEFCTVAARLSPGDEWIEKQDCGTESNTEKSKGETSDAFKRACFSWGIGRELYTKIMIFIKVETQKNTKGAFEMVDKYAKFFVTKIETDNKAKKILHLEISDKFNKKVFEWDNKNPPKHEDLDEDEAPQYKCMDCNTPFVSVNVKGTVYTPQELFEGAQKANADGKARCKSCKEKLAGETPKGE